MSYALISNLVMLVGFTVTAYAIIANNTPQTLGPFIRSNSARSWWFFWLFASVVLLVVVVYGWVVNNGDVCYGRLDAIPVPDQYTWIHLIPPLALMALTKFGMPVSPTFLIVPAFATAGLSPMLRNALVGYIAGFVASVVLYRALIRLERHFISTRDRPTGQVWAALQLITTGFLWSQWLIQNLANVYAYVPRQLTVWEMALVVVGLVALLASVLRARGGATQRIIYTKTNLQDVRSATLFDLLYGSLLMAFFWTSKVPMSTTWVFLGAIGARELALTVSWGRLLRSSTIRMLGREFALALVGLIVSLLIALTLPKLHQTIDRTFNFDGDVVTETQTSFSGR
jgi:phosphate/sulfate permease